MRRLNLHALETAVDEEDPGPFRSGMNRFGGNIGAELLGGTVYDLPPGTSICPYHFEYGDEEWLIVLSGTPTVRTPEGEQAAEPGDVVCFPRGPDGAHRIGNDSNEPARVLMISTLNEPSVAVYPDSDKLGVFVGDYRLLVTRDSGVDYFHGEA